MQSGTVFLLLLDTSLVWPLDGSKCSLSEIIEGFNRKLIFVMRFFKNEIIVRMNVKCYQNQITNISCDWKHFCTQVLPCEFTFCFSFQQTHYQPGSSSHQQGESWAAASACGHPGHLWTVFQRIPGRRQAHSSRLFFMVNGLTWFGILLLISSFFFFSVDWDFGQDVGPMSTLSKSVRSSVLLPLSEKWRGWLFF